MGEVNYFQRSNGLEIDFILNRELAVEVKETPGASDWEALRQRAQGLGLQPCWLVGRQPPPSGFQHFYWGGSLF